MTETIRILDTGTTPVDSIPDGVDVVHQPALVRRALPFDKAAIRALLRKPSHIVFYSRFTVDVVADAEVIDEADRHDFWAVGARTADLVTHRFDATATTPVDEDFQGLIAALIRCSKPRQIVAFGLVGTDRDLNPVAQRWNVDFTVIPTYESMPNAPADLVAAFTTHRPHWLTVTSSRGAHAIADAIGIEQLHNVKLAAIGPSTANALIDLGLTVDFVPDQPNRVEMLRAIATS